MVGKKRSIDAHRQGLLDRLAILDTPAEILYQDAAALVAQIFDTPLAYVGLADGDRLWFKARVGVPVTEIPLADSFCKTLLTNNSTLVVENALLDARFKTNPFVIGEHHIRFYAGAVIYAEDMPVGSLCVLSQEPKEVAPTEIAALEALARQVSSVLDLRLLARKIGEKESETYVALEKTEELSALLEHSARRFENLFRAMPVACMTLDKQGVVMEWNAKCTEVFGVDESEASWKNVFDLIFDHEQSEEERLRLRLAVEKGEGFGTPYERLSRRSDHSPIWLLSTYYPIHSPSGELMGVICTNVDITDRKTAESQLIASHLTIQSQKEALEQANERLTRLATTDGLTGLNNHRAFQEFLAQAVINAKANGHPLSLTLLDVDHFKSFNDQYGHPQGDAVLKQVAQMISDFSRKTDFVARYGGEEFVVVMPNTDEGKAKLVAERLRHTLEKSAWPARPVTASFGNSTLSDDVTDAASLIKCADEALYQAKRTGRNRVCSYLRCEELSRRAA